MKVPFVDLQLQFQNIREDVLPAVESIMERTDFILGDEVSAFEQDFAAFCGADECVGVASGCDALLWAIKACGVGPGDEVITTANTYIATTFAITMAGATPVLVDCTEEAYLMNPTALEGAITPRTKAVIPVHLYGQAANMDVIQEITDRHGLVVIEDAAQAHGATYKGKACGSMGRVGCFSFYPGKNLGAYGDGGGIVTNDPEIAEKVRMYRNYGQSKKYHHDVPGWNSRLDTIQAAVLGAKLPHLSDWNGRRYRNADLYVEGLAGLPVQVPVELPDNVHIYHLFVIRTARRDELLEALKAAEVFCSIHYPIPIHLQKAYSDLGYAKGDFPVTERAAEEILSLPMFPELTEAQIEHVCSRVADFFG